VIERIDPRLLHAANRIFLDYVTGTDTALGFFERAPGDVEAAADDRRSGAFPRTALAARLRTYNERLDVPRAVLEHIDTLEEPHSLCVIGGQQAGFLGGALFTAYKALSVVRAASRLAERLRAPVVPVFWLATEDHDLTEINRIRTLDPSGNLRTISFDWDGRGRPIERLPITPDVRAAAEEAFELFPPKYASARDLFLPHSSDDYAMWHARIWSRLFGASGLILVEPRAIRDLAGPFFGRALTSADQIGAALAESGAALRAAEYAVPLDPETAGGLFSFGDDGRRIRIADPLSHAARAAEAPTDYSPDAALRPVLADALFPTIASIVGAAELAYHAMLRPVYRLFGIPQPILLPRPGYTLVTAPQAALLARCGASVSDVLAGRFDAKAAARSAVSADLLALFAERKTSVREALRPLYHRLEDLDPGLAARWRQTVDRIEEQIDRLEERAVRADSARSGVSLRALRRLDVEIRPAGRLQERVLSLIHVAARDGLSWLAGLESPPDPGEYAHYAVTVGGSDE